ncbi:ATP-binding protein [Actinomadura madurae]|uniref:ATP-binding protein n=1 Tax=Actinomadura madurae TaxID=1993 RepID=UPI0020D22CCD|nr:ATP-binding protein [Actinomadura madurae]MCP9947560.1 ATP-binding protein [Actinomadura madurae]MCP9964328.1 ATP-binding protein [Actinomadura madurae]MCP9976815.1 ATP-binding protein [Actinomadura madurae]MCQ0011703.1 ATP-binding protein [Actinomadura madurae]MCQ0012993.1 ATP-binding protein [Actinomadura madurae]
MHTTGTSTTRPAAGDDATTSAIGGAHDTVNDRPGAAAGWDLDPGPRAASRARALAGEALRRWRVTDPAALDDIVLIVDELVTNAVVHGSGPVRLTLRLDTAPDGTVPGEPVRTGLGAAADAAGGTADPAPGGAPEGTRQPVRLVGEVSDAASAVPRVPAEPPRVLDWSEAGRGLLLVAALATEFGARPGPSGKTVWFTRHLSRPPGHPTATATATGTGAVNGAVNGTGSGSGAGTVGGAARN